jgi:hypothetical protein
MVRALLGMQEIPEPSDAADALAVALCHVQAERYERRFGLPSRPASRTSPAAIRATATRGPGISTLP